jgi:hypothetical protein
MTQIFKINPDGTTTELTTSGAIKDIMEPNECYVLVADDIRKVFLWIGSKSNVRSKFIGAKRSQEIRGQVGLHYSTDSIDEGDEPADLIKIMGGKTAAGIAKEIKEEKVASGAVHPLREKSTFAPPTPAEGMNIAGSKGQSAQNTGPLYTGQKSMTSYTQEENHINFEQIMQKLEEITIPDGFERELIIIGNHAYSVVEKVQTFLGKKQVSKEISKVGAIPEGVFFAEDYSPRILSENGKIIAIEFLKQISAPKDKKSILKDQIKKQLG